MEGQWYPYTPTGIANIRKPIFIFLTITASGNRLIKPVTYTPLMLQVTAVWNCGDGREWNGKKRIWIGGLSGVAYQTVIETLDGFSTQWGWSWGDFASNIFGSGMMIGQQLVWDDQRVLMKFSTHKRNYNSADLNSRANELFGKTFGERFIKDYNAQTYWLSANIKSFFPQSGLPAW
jgi:hypothetical protein